MNTKELVDYIESLFDTNIKAFKDETGLIQGCDEIKSLGYCTNLSEDVIEKAHKLGVDFILTHHDAWDFVYGLKERCLDLLKKYNMGHYFIHLPLDDCSFGTNDTLAKELGLTIVKRNELEDGYYCGRIAEYDEAITFESFVDRVEALTGERVQAWQFKGPMIKKVGLVCGAGLFTTTMKNFVDENCDVYLTGEKLLYTVEYAEVSKMNLIVGSHTFTELSGVKSLAEMIANALSISVVCIPENHLESSTGIFIK